MFVDVTKHWGGPKVFSDLVERMFPAPITWWLNAILTPAYDACVWNPFAAIVYDEEVKPSVLTWQVRTGTVFAAFALSVVAVVRKILCSGKPAKSKSA
jgi:hypothetical protein